MKAALLMGTNIWILLLFTGRELKLPLRLSSPPLPLSSAVVFSADYRAVAVRGHYPPLSSLLPMWWQALKKSFTQLEAQGPQTSEACARPLDTNHADVYSIVSLLLSLPFPPSSPPFLLSLCFFFPPLHFDTPSPALSESLAVHLKPGFTAGKHS